MRIFFTPAVREEGSFFSHPPRLCTPSSSLYASYPFRFVSSPSLRTYNFFSNSSKRLSIALYVHCSVNILKMPVKDLLHGIKLLLGKRDMLIAECPHHR